MESSKLQQPFLLRNKKTHNIIIGQKVSPSKVERTREFRRQMIPEEKILWQRLRANRLNGLHFRRQQILDGFIVDFYCHSAGVVVEVNGEIHEQQVEYDADCVLLMQGIRLLRFKNEEVRQQLHRVLTSIVTVCSEET